MRKRFWGCGIALIVVMCIPLWFGSRDYLNLLDHATRIVSVRGWGLERPDIDMPVRIYNLMGGGAQYQWVGNKQILFFHGLTPIQMTVTPATGQSNLAWPDSVGTPTLYDVATHREVPLPALAALFRRSHGQAQGATVSPGGSRLLWRDDNQNNHIAMLDGSRHLRIENGGSPDMGWSAGSKQFYTYGWSEDNDTLYTVPAN